MKEETQKAEKPEKAEKPAKPKLTLHSVDEHTGVVVCLTDAADGTEVAIRVDGKRFETKAQGGQAWFRTGARIQYLHSIRL